MLKSVGQYFAQINNISNSIITLVTIKNGQIHKKTVISNTTNFKSTTNVQIMPLELCTVYIQCTVENKFKIKL